MVWFKDVRAGTRKLDKLCREDLAAARRLSEKDVRKLMGGRPKTSRTLADGTRQLVWNQGFSVVGIVFTKNHLFNRIYYRRGA